MISNDEMEDVVKIVKSLEYSGLLLKGVKKKRKFIRRKFIRKYVSR